ncbi:MAG: Fe-S cluster assembly protein HesB [Candidatus Heimdallarchaeota archaeon]|nr:Fe-S cluster assembly protein HesB [Candidatus Heimdallarchaeota archaeon]MCK4876168.1 Fe-S cluster assembly protein HesB [Candidatus Heimdallarchaeota archaeon]
MSFEIKNDKMKSFQDKIFSWWKDNKRDFPWRETNNPYLIMVSEIMLQQTQAPRVVEKYLSFIDKFPDMESLSNSSQTELLHLWSGLGYNRRALWLKEAARKILELGSFPQTPKELQKLKGIGPYSARSILIFAFNSDIATVDTNIRRILVAEGFASEKTSEKDLLKIAEELLPKYKSRDWHNALMDYGSIVLTASKTGIKPTSQQSKFKGSDRQYRGLILQYLLKNEKASIKEIISEFELEEERAISILHKMISDKLIHQKNEFFFIH